MSFTFSFDKYDYTDEDIILPSNTVFYRGVPSNVDKTNIVRNRPMYVATKETAQHYGEQVVALRATRNLRLIDFRKMKHQVRLLLASRPPAEANDDLKRSIFYLTIAFGLCSYQRQISLLDEFLKHNSQDLPDADIKDLSKRIKWMKTAYLQLHHSSLNPFEPEGVRVAETFIDSHVMLILEEIYKKRFDGFIAPRMFSPFHVDTTTHEEIVLFDAKQKVSLEVNIQPKLIQLQTVLRRMYTPLELSFHKDFSLTILQKQKGGSGSKVLDRNRFFEDNAFKSVYKNAIRNAKVFRKYYIKAEIQNTSNEPLKAKCELHFTKDPIIPIPTLFTSS